jgi:hypothetical protein
VAGQMAANLEMMGLWDWISLIFAIGVVSLTLVGEIKDIELVKIAARNADTLSPGWRAAMCCLGLARRYLFLPFLLGTVPNLVLLKGSDALNVCTNTAAILFVSEIDNVLFSMGLPERIRSRIEQEGRVELDEEEADNLARTKWTHGLTLWLGVIVVIMSGDPWPNIAVPMVAGVVDALVADGVTAVGLKRAGLVIVYSLLGFSIFFSLFVVSLGSATRNGGAAD